MSIFHVDSWIQKLVQIIILFHVKSDQKLGTLDLIEKFVNTFKLGPVVLQLQSLHYKNSKEGSWINKTTVLIQISDIMEM